MFGRESEINLRHLQGFAEICALGTVTAAADRVHLSQPALSQAVAGLEAQTGQQLFHRRARQLIATEAGELLLPRALRALKHFAAAGEIFPRAAFQPSTAQMRAFCAICTAHSFTAAARFLQLAQPTVHRAVRTLEAEARSPLLERRRTGFFMSPDGARLHRASLLAFAEIRQALEELDQFAGRQSGTILIGGTPLARSAILPGAIARFSTQFPGIRIRVEEGPYASQMTALRNGELDFLAGALRPLEQSEGVEREVLFTDGIAVVCAPSHPARALQDPAQLARYPWAIAPAGTPTRRAFETLFRNTETMELVETSSSVLLTRLLRRGRHLGFVSKAQVSDEEADGALVRLSLQVAGSERQIGVTFRAGWVPTPAQASFLQVLREVGGQLGGS